MTIRSHAAGLTTTEQIGQEISIAGWVNRRRDHGGVIFMVGLIADGTMAASFLLT